MPYVTMHRTLECINNKFIKRPVFMNLHKFVLHIKMSLYGIIVHDSRGTLPADYIYANCVLELDIIHA